VFANHIGDSAAKPLDPERHSGDIVVRQLGPIELRNHSLQSDAGTESIAYFSRYLN